MIDGGVAVEAVEQHLDSLALTLVQKRPADEEVRGVKGLPETWMDARIIEEQRPELVHPAADVPPNPGGLARSPRDSSIRGKSGKTAEIVVHSTPSSSPAPRSPDESSPPLRSKPHRRSCGRRMAIASRNASRKAPTGSSGTDEGLKRSKRHTSGSVPGTHRRA